MTDRTICDDLTQSIMGIREETRYRSRDGTLTNYTKKSLVFLGRAAEVLPIFLAIMLTAALFFEELQRSALYLIVLPVLLSVIFYIGLVLWKKD